jgi:hypothetical protein
VYFIEDGAASQLAGSEKFAQLFCHSRPCLQQWQQSVLRYLIENDFGQGGNLAVNRPTGQKSYFAKIDSDWTIVPGETINSVAAKLLRCI